MPSYKQPIYDMFMKVDTACLRFGEPSSEHGCRTRNLVDNFYQCQTHRLDCIHASTFGMSYLCNSPDREEYAEETG